jgi:hypothetical protein
MGILLVPGQNQAPTWVLGYSTQHNEELGIFRHFGLRELNPVGTAPTRLLTEIPTN